MKKNVLCINPPVRESKNRCTREGRCSIEEDAWTVTYPPVTLASIAGHIRNKGHKVKLMDCIGADTSWEEFEKELVSFKPDVAIINTAIPTIKNDLSLCDMIKGHFPKCTVAVYGTFPSVDSKRIKKIQPNVDWWIKGEPETPALQIVEGKKPPGELWIEPDINTLAMPAYDLLPKYIFPLTNERWMFLVDGRGCPYHCIYCVESSLSKGNLRYKSAEKVVSEMEYLVENQKISFIMFWNDLFTFDRERVVKICELITKKGLHKKCKWLVTTRVDTVDEELFHIMKKAGCRIVAFGIESGNQKVLNRAKKGITLKQIKSAVSAAKSAGLGTIGHFIIGLPDSTPKTEEETISLSKSLDLDFAQFYCCTAFPGSELYKEFIENKGASTNDWSDLQFGSATMNYENFSTEQMQKIRRKAYISFYIRPRIIKSFLSLASFSGALHALPKMIKFSRWIRR